MRSARYLEEMLNSFLAGLVWVVFFVCLFSLQTESARGQQPLPDNLDEYTPEGTIPRNSPSIGSPALNPNFDPDPELRLKRYLLGPGDQIAIQVQRFPDLSVSTTVGPEGTIQMPLIGTVLLQGLTLEAARILIGDRLNEFIKNPEIVVSLLAQRPVRVTITGEVTRPGFYPVPGNAQISDALRAAGGTSFLADLRNVKVRRTLASGVVVSQIVDVLTPLQVGAPPPNLRLEDGDVVIVPYQPSLDAQQQDRELITNYSQAGPVIPAIVTVTGEVTRPGFYQANQVSSALLQAGGTTLKADLRKVRVRRTLVDGTIIEEVVDLYTPLLNSTELPDVPLQNGDAVIISDLEPGADFGYDRTLVSKSTLAQQQITVRIFSHPNNALATTPLANGSRLIEVLNGIPVNVADLKEITLIRFDREQNQVIQRELNGKDAIFGDSSQNILLQDEDVIVLNRNWLNQINYVFSSYTEPIRDFLGFVLFFRSLQRDSANIFFGGGGNNNNRNNNRN
ncbi:MAG: SLBB domain-containing protein [Cyanobacteriota bacterium]|nr:SLBB domain-containing protein [Cyanobacteriota bacterium]